MTKHYKLLLGACAVVAAFVAGTWYHGNGAATATNPPARKILYWHDPMHPSYKSDKPGIAPDCGMQLEPVYSDSAEPEAGSSAGAVAVNANRRQMIGVRLGKAEVAAPTQEMRLLGQVVTDETQVYRLFGGGEGWVRDISPQAVGMVVQKDELLATYFSRDFQTTENGYIFALSNRDKTVAPEQTTSYLTNVRNAEEALLSLGMSPTQMAEIARTRVAATIIQVRAPETGIIQVRNVSHNLRIDRNSELYRLADIRTVYVYAEAPELEAEYITQGADAEVRYQGRVLKAHIAKALPLFDTDTRRLKLRLEMNNPGYVLRPGMFVDVQVPVRLTSGVTVPAEALMDSGMRRVVYVAHGEGSFEARPVETGWRFGGRVQILSGIRAGESIVVSGNFLIDSEARMAAVSEAAPSGIRVKDPVCGMEIDRNSAAGNAGYNGHTYYFCSRSCEEKFEKNPKQYASQEEAHIVKAKAPAR